MNPEEMLSILKSLQEELENAESIHPNHRESLRSLTQEIQQTLASGAPPNAAGSTDTLPAATLSQQMKESIIEFEVRHPIIGGLVERLTDGLAGMGI
ncbi:MAG: DUF4404 family protein [Planctomycetota bacterium]|nr:DUF4404 family protein [Planctomycetota bacterium]